MSDDEADKEEEQQETDQPGGSGHSDSSAGDDSPVGEHPSAGVCLCSLRGLVPYSAADRCCACFACP